MSALLADTFNRADSATQPGTPSTGGPYTAANGTWGIRSNALYTSTSVANAVLTFPATSDLDISATFLTQLDGAGIVFRFVDISNFWTLRRPASNGQWELARRVAGTFATFVSGPRATPGDTARVVAVGEDLYMIINSKLYGATQDSWASVPAANASAGFWINASTLAQIDSAAADDAPAIPSLPTTAAVSDDAASMSATPNSSAFLYKGRDTAIQDTGEVA